MSDELHCADVEPYLSAFADGELAEPLRSEVAAHVRTCDSCADEVDRYQTIDRLIARLPYTRPSPDVFVRVQAAVAQRHSEYVSRERIRAATADDANDADDASLNGGKRLELPAPVETLAAPKPTPITRGASRNNRRNRKRIRRPPAWMTGALPTVAALLLVAVALTLLLRLPHGLSLPSATHTGGPTQSTGAVLKQTGVAIAQVAPALTFTPTLPTYLPEQAHFSGASIGPSASGDKSSHYLDVIWTFTSGPVSQLRVREAPTRLGFPDYALAAPSATNATLFWGLPQMALWQPLAHPATTTQDMIVGQQRAQVNIVVDARPSSSSSPQDASVITIARIVSLSMDRPFMPLTLRGPDNTATLHFTAAVTNGQRTWQVDTWLKGSPADPNRSEVAHITGPGVNLLDTTLNGQTTRLDENQRLYQTLSAQLTANALAEPQQNITEPFYSATLYIQDGEMWNMGRTQYQGQSVYAFALVNTPGVTLYANADAKQAVALVAQASVLQTPRVMGSTVPAARLVSTTECQNDTVLYTSLEYVASYTFAAPDLKQSKPAPANVSLPTGFSCSAA